MQNVLENLKSLRASYRAMPYFLRTATYEDRAAIERLILPCPPVAEILGVLKRHKR
jgi:hypothetical protein